MTANRPALHSYFEPRLITSIEIISTTSYICGATSHHTMVLDLDPARDLSRMFLSQAELLRTYRSENAAGRLPSSMVSSFGEFDRALSMFPNEKAAAEEMESIQGPSGTWSEPNNNTAPASLHLLNHLVSCSRCETAPIMEPHSVIARFQTRFKQNARLDPRQCLHEFLMKLL